MMTFHPDIETVLKEFPPERLRAMELWLTQESRIDEGEDAPMIEAMNADLQENVSDVETCYRLLNQLELDELVSFSLMNEFGPNFSQHACFTPLNKGITQRIQEQLS